MVEAKSSALSPSRIATMEVKSTGLTAPSSVGATGDELRVSVVVTQRMVARKTNDNAPGGKPNRTS